jgi:hypothetical protein
MTFQVPPAINLTFSPRVENLDEFIKLKVEYCLYDSDSPSERPDSGAIAILEKSKLVDIIINGIVTTMYTQHGSKITIL